MLRPVEVLKGNMLVTLHLQEILPYYITSYIMLQIPESILALSLQNDLISFLHLRSSLEVTRWECKSLFEGQKSRRLDALHIQKAVRI